MLKRKKATVRKAMQGSNRIWSAVAVIDGTKTEVLIQFGLTEPDIGKRLVIEGSGREWKEATQ